MLGAALVAAIATANALPTAVATPNPNAGPKTMVALGDSFASAPLVPVQYEQPWGCMRSSNNYAHQVARELDLALTDVTCSGAQTKHMEKESQGVSPEEELAEYGGSFGYEGYPGNPPQLDARRPDTDVVTLQIGGNDIGFVDIARTCAEGEVAGPGCEEAVAETDPDGAIEQAARDITAVLEEIHRRSPGAAIYVLGYPGIFKIGETAGCPAMAAEETDAKYLRGIHEKLNAMIQRVADDPAQTYSAAASYVDVYTPSAGHTACDLPAIRWVEPIVPVNAAYPVHPNLGGMTAIGDILVEQIWPKGLPRRDTPPGLPAPPDSPL